MLNTAPSRRSTLKPIFITSAMDCRVFVCFATGPDHDQPIRKESDQRERGKLADLGYRILTIRYDSRLEDQMVANRDVFGAGNQVVGV